MAELKSKRDDFTKTLSLLRKEVKVATNIMDDNDEIKRNLKVKRQYNKNVLLRSKKQDIGTMTYADKENFMKKYITDENTGINYTLVGDVYIPNLVSTDTNYEIGYWGRKHKEYIRQYKPAFYTTLLTQCKLNSYLHDVDVRVTEMYDTLVKQLVKQEGVTEKLKATDMMLWIQKMNNIRNRATEIVNVELIYTV